ncbi:hypothetical protein B0H10DRAFT_2161178 [Mycena sp. CBHHK59/15]|nr:hypothetical protein B0H10DRAFT_2161178 [Mycena sp. CBHHK59/15]
MPSQLFDIQTQLTFYGAYHTNRINIIIHCICVPLLLWYGLVLLAEAARTTKYLQVVSSNGLQDPGPGFYADCAPRLLGHLIFDLNYSALHAALYLAYYFALEPLAALLYTPQIVLSLLTATAYSRSASHIAHAGILHALSWVAQFAGHGLAEKRAPALLDNLIGAVVLAPFFVHLEILFLLGYKPEMHKRLNNEIGKEITKIRKAKGDQKRAAAAKEN